MHFCPVILMHIKLELHIVEFHSFFSELFQPSEVCSLLVAYVMKYSFILTLVLHLYISV